MLFRRLGRRAQSTAEYAIIIGLVIAAASVMQIYVKRGLQGKVADAVDTKLGRQFEPAYNIKDTSTSNRTDTRGSKSEIGGASTKTGVGTVKAKQEQTDFGTQGQ